MTCTSPYVTPTNPMFHPYEELMAFLGISSDGQSEWIYGFNKTPHLNILKLVKSH